MKLWPIFLAVNEIPVQSRFARDNIILAGIWQGKDKPPFLQYLWSFGEEMCRLHDEGITIHPPCLADSITVKLSVLCGTVDLQAKAYILNMTMFNGEYGCSTCEEPGVTERQGKGYARFYPYRESNVKPQIRSSEDVKYVKGPNATKCKRLKGICGISGLNAMPWFDVVWGILPDYMHGVLMGVTKKLLYLWFSPTSSGQQYFVGNHLKKISARLYNIQPPDYVERLPRDIEKHYSNFKATELQTWLLFYSIPCMKDILAEEYHSHLCLLSEGVYLLLGQTITEEEITRAECLLEEFYKSFPLLYNKGSCGLNFHNVGSHLTSFVRQWGPLWAWSCFPFEDANAAILNSVHGTGDVTQQCIRMKEVEMRLRSVDLNLIPSGSDKRFIGKLTNSSRPWKKTAVNNCEITGRKTVIGERRNMEQLLCSSGAISATELCVVLRVRVNGEKLYSKEYSRMKRRVCYIVCTKEGGIVSIEYFVLNTTTGIVFAVGNQMVPTSSCFLNENSGRHIVKVEKYTDQVVVEVDKIQEKLFFMRVEDDICIARMPNLCGHGVFK